LKINLLVFKPKDDFLAGSEQGVACAIN